MGSRLNATAFIDFGSLFNAFMNEKRSEDAKFSYRYLARKLENSSASALNMFAKGSRIPTHNQLNELLDHMDLEESDKKYASLLVAFRRAKDPSERSHIAEQIAEHAPNQVAVEIDLEALELLSSWHYFVILDLVQLPSFQSDLPWIQAKLGSSMSAEKVAESIDRLTKMGYLGIVGDKIIRSAKVFRTPRNIPSSAIRNLHKQYLVKAAYALDRQEVSERFFSNSTFPIATADIDRAQKMIVEFRQKFIKEFEVEDGDEIYDLAINFFRLTDIVADDQE